MYCVVLVPPSFMSRPDSWTERRDTDVYEAGYPDVVLRTQMDDGVSMDVCYGISDRGSEEIMSDKNEDDSPDQDTNTEDTLDDNSFMVNEGPVEFEEEWLEKQDNIGSLKAERDSPGLEEQRTSNNPKEEYSDKDVNYETYERSQQVEGFEGTSKIRINVDEVSLETDAYCEALDIDKNQARGHQQNLSNQYDDSRPSDAAGGSDASPETGAGGCEAASPETDLGVSDASPETGLGGSEASPEIDHYDRSLRIYTDIHEGAPEVYRDVEESEETLGDGTVVTRRVVKTHQQRTINRNIRVEGLGEDEALPVDHNQISQLLAQLGERAESEGGDQLWGAQPSSSTVEEFEEEV